MSEKKVRASNVIGLGVGLAAFISSMTYAVTDYQADAEERALASMEQEFTPSSLGKGDVWVMTTLFFGASSALLGTLVALGAGKIEDEIEKKKKQNNKRIAVKSR